MGALCWGRPPGQTPPGGTAKTRGGRKEEERRKRGRRKEKKEEEKRKSEEKGRRKTKSRERASLFPCRGTVWMRWGLYRLYVLGSTYTTAKTPKRLLAGRGTEIGLWGQSAFRPNTQTTGQTKPGKLTKRLSEASWLRVHRLRITLGWVGDGKFPKIRAC